MCIFFSALQGFLSENRPVRTLREIVDSMNKAYCTSTGIEYMHITDRQKCNWIRERVELYKPFEVCPRPSNILSPPSKQGLPLLVHCSTPRK